LKLAKIGTLRALGGQDLSPKNLKWWMGLELCARLVEALKKKIPDLVVSSQWTHENFLS
jgi:hypothetical protein